MAFATASTCQRQRDTIGHGLAFASRSVNKISALFPVIPV